ncbi:hypothetical protein EK904_004204 [Melospiza melodia maxima]|nr:hypothetical protein EK904_004204 [Melospiza melodia maxima]
MEQGGWQRWLLLLVGIQLASSQCPEQCQCVRSAQVECFGADISTVPSPIPANAMTLQIINTRIAELGDAAFGNASLLIGLRGPTQVPPQQLLCRMWLLTASGEGGITLAVTGWAGAQIKTLGRQLGGKCFPFLQGEC